MLNSQWAVYRCFVRLLYSTCIPSDCFNGPVLIAFLSLLPSFSEMEQEKKNVAQQLFASSSRFLLLFIILSAQIRASSDRVHKV